MSEIINIKGSNIQEIISTDYFICRYYIRKDSSAIQKVIPQSLFIRGMELSHYNEAYKEFLKSSSANFELDDYSIAIQRLHLSVIPEVLPCRESERKAIEDFIRKSISVQQKSSPFYICGIPGISNDIKRILLLAKSFIEIRVWKNRHSFIFDQ